MFERIIELLIDKSPIFIVSVMALMIAGLALVFGMMVVKAKSTLRNDD